MLSGIVESEYCASLGYAKRYLHLALMSNDYIEWMHVDDIREIVQCIMLHTLPYGVRERA